MKELSDFADELKEKDPYFLCDKNSVQQLRDYAQCSMFAAKKEINRRILLDQIRNAESIEDIKLILEIALCK